MKALGRSISVVVCGGLLAGFSIGNAGGCVFSHLFFADDTLIFYGVLLRCLEDDSKIRF